MKKIRFYVFLGFLSILSVGHAETLAEVMAYTYDNSMAILAQRAALKGVDEGVAKAKSGYRPTAGMDFSVGQSHNKMTASGVEQTKDQTPKTASISISQPIFSGLTTYRTVQMAQHQAQAAEEDLNAFQQNTLLSSVVAYMDLIRDYAVLQLCQHNEAVLQQHFDEINMRFSVGKLTQTDVAQAKARLSGAVARRIEAEGQVKISRARYLDVIQKEASVLVDTTKFLAPLPRSLPEALDVAFKNNPSLKAAQLASKAYAYNVKAKEGTLLPSVGVNASSGYLRENDSIDKGHYWKVNANLSVPLYQGGGDYAAIREAKHLENQYRILVTKTHLDVETAVVAAWEEYQAARAEIRAIRHQIGASQVALEGVIQEERVGRRTVLDVLDAELEHLNNQVAYREAHRNEIVSGYALLATIGRLTPDYLHLAVEIYDPKVYYDSVQNKWFGVN